MGRFSLFQFEPDMSLIILYNVFVSFLEEVSSASMHLFLTHAFASLLKQFFTALFNLLYFFPSVMSLEIDFTRSSFSFTILRSSTSLHVRSEIHCSLREPLRNPIPFFAASCTADLKLLLVTVSNVHTFQTIQIIRRLSLRTL